MEAAISLPSEDKIHIPTAADIHEHAGILPISTRPVNRFSVAIQERDAEVPNVTQLTHSSRSFAPPDIGFQEEL